MKQTTKKQPKTTLLIIALSILIGSGLVLWSYNTAGKSGRSPENEVESGQGQLSVTEPTYDFSEVSMARGLVNHEFVLNNSSSASVKVGAVETSCMCTTAYLKVGESGKEVGPFGMAGHSGLKNSANLIVPPGEKLIVRAVFDPAAHGPAGVGPIERQIILEVGGSPLTLDFKALVKP